MWASTGQILGCAAPQVGDLCLFEGGGERGGALGFDRVALETVSKQRCGDGERAGCHGAMTGKQTLFGGSAGALQRGQSVALWETRSEGHDPGQVDHL